MTNRIFGVVPVCRSPSPPRRSEATLNYRSWRGTFLTRSLFHAAGFSTVGSTRARRHRHTKSTALSDEPLVRHDIEARHPDECPPAVASTNFVDPDQNGRREQCLSYFKVRERGSIEAGAFVKSKRTVDTSSSPASVISATRKRESSGIVPPAQPITTGVIVASIVHEINQPLAAIAANASAGLRWLALAPPDIDEGRAAFERINDDAHRAAAVIEGIRSIFTKDNQLGALLNINDIISEILALVHSQLAKHGVFARADLIQDLPHVRADRVQLRQVILNLIMNAVDAMSSVESRARILIVTSKLQNAKSVVITVQDTGTGIDGRNTNRIFNAFFSTKSSGMGMSLFICRSIIEAHGGRLWATPRLPYGSIFHIVLPIGNG
jgi:Histidine kinase-, DNA gyrase B-, and HSP90-like ATPase/His Kinase A (phospho-acceptor) domain